MAVTEQNGLMKYKDKAGNLYILYPITNADNVDGLTELVESKVYSKGILTTGTGETYLATVPGITSLEDGVSFVMVPHVSNTVIGVGLNVNGLGEKALKRRVTGSTNQYILMNDSNVLVANCPVRVTYNSNNNCWFIDMDMARASDLYGSLPAKKIKNVDSELRTYDKGVTTAGTGAAYTATVGSINSLEKGMSFIMIPHTASTSQTATLNVNSLGAKTLRRPLSGSNSATTAPDTTNWLTANKPIRVTYDGTYWVVDMPKPDVADLYGEVASGPKAVTITLASGSWSSNTQTVTVNGILADETKQLIQVNPASASRTAYISAGIICSGQAANSLTFTCTTTPTSDLTVYVTYQEVT